MTTMHNDYPNYGWNTNKGYGTAFHLNALKEHGATQHHRRTFRPISLMYGTTT
jgi:ribonuclease HII